MAIDGVRSTHHTHVWSLDGTSHVLSTHVVVDGSTSREDAFRVKCDVRALLRGDHRHTTVEIEYPDEKCPTTAVH